MMMVQKPFALDQFEITAPWPGRILQIILGAGFHNLQILGAHLTRSPPDFTWTDMATRLRDEIREHRGPAIILGDFNFVDSIEDTISRDSGLPCGNPGYRAHWWQHHLGHLAQVNAGFTHRNLALNTLSAIDRMYSTWSLPILQALRADLEFSGRQLLATIGRSVFIGYPLEKIIVTLLGSIVIHLGAPLLI